LLGIASFCRQSKRPCYSASLRLLIELLFCSPFHSLFSSPPVRPCSHRDQLFIGRFTADPVGHSSVSQSTRRCFGDFLSSSSSFSSSSSSSSSLDSNRQSPTTQIVPKAPVACASPLVHLAKVCLVCFCCCFFFGFFGFGFFSCSWSSPHTHTPPLTLLYFSLSLSLSLALSLSLYHRIHTTLSVTLVSAAKKFSIHKQSRLDSGVVTSTTNNFTRSTALSFGGECAPNPKSQSLGAESHLIHALLTFMSSLALCLSTFVYHVPTN
jgi:hypothetical protein